VAEDEGLIRRLMAKLLDAQGHKVFEAEDGETALEFFRSERPDVVITDIRMPGMDGIALMREVRAVAPEAEVILITGFAERTWSSRRCGREHRTSWRSPSTSTP
jgi:two-component system NtrC family sensor kinase